MRAFKMSAMLLLLAAHLSGFAAGMAEPEPSLTGVVSEIVQAYGGAQALERITSVYAEGAIDATARNDHGTYKRWLKRPRLLRVDVAYANNTESRILNGDQAWRSEGGPMRSLNSGPAYLSVVYQYKALDIVYGLLKERYALQFAGKEDQDGSDTLVIEAQDKEGPPLRIHVDPRTHYITAVSGRISMGMAQVELGATYADFRLVAGVPMPFRIHNFAGGGPVSETVIQRYIVNSTDTEDPALFNPPIYEHHGRSLSLIRPSRARPGGVL